jgi:hypothetical protein
MSVAQFPTISFQFDYGFAKKGVDFSFDNNLISIFYENNYIKPNKHFEKIQSKSLGGDFYYKFNSGKDIDGNPIDFKYQKNFGYYGGLTAEVFIGRPDQFVAKSQPQTHTSSFKIYIHNLTLNAVESTDNPIDLTPGLSTQLKIKRIFKERLPYPYNDCIQNVSSYNSLLVKHILTKTYSSYRQKDCYNLCQSQYMINNCNLTVPLGFIWEVNWRKDNKFPCVNDLNYRFFKNNLNDLCLKDCPFECNSIEFSIDVTTSKFPSQAYALRLMNDSKIKSNYPPGYNITLEDLRESMVQFSVYYTDFEYTKIGQIPKQQFTDIVSNLGGLLGLFIGMSFLSFGELIEVLVEVFLIFLEKKNKVKQSTIS